MTKRTKSRKIKTRKNKSRRYKGRTYRIKGGSCANTGSVDHNPPKWYSDVIKGGSHMNDDLYNQYTDMTPYSISR
jgi:hypothetical protein